MKDISKTELDSLYSWTRYADKIEKVTIQGEIILPETARLFTNLKKLREIENIELINTSYVNDMSYMFYQTKKLESLNLSNWDVSNITNMNNLFNGSSNLKSLNLSNWDVSNVETMVNIFEGVQNLTSSELLNWNEFQKEIMSSNIGTKILTKKEIYRQNAAPIVEEKLENEVTGWEKINGIGTI